ncbi:CBS domain-containing protein [Gandjariella thermophila]|uniref:CBS domain-containing protein n=1 Tax=Gandjariella thermophila TaxID=1931992 RepID=A0A4D4JG73_9PSEU|nr:CBS domain-containing protein [Gandjariella thermophila]
MREVMTSPAVTFRPETPLKQAARVLVQRGFTAAAVVDADGRLLGIVTDADLVRDRIACDPRSRRGGELPQSVATSALVREVMTTPVTTVAPSADVAEVARMMLTEHLRSLPVVDGGDLVGMLTRSDLVRMIARDDRSIATDVRRRLATYARCRRWDVEVSEGTVTVAGVFTDEVERHVVTALAQAVPGVQHVDTMADRA